MTTARAFRGFRFPAEVILWAVRWYLAFPVSHRDLEATLADRGVFVDHVTLYRRVQRFAPELEKRVRRHLRPCRGPWHVDETFVRVGGGWRYLYRAVDGTGRTIDFLLSATRDKKAAERFLRKALQKEPLLAPDRIGTGCVGPDPPAIAATRKAGLLARTPIHYVTKHLQQGIESDHFRVTKNMPRIGGFRSFGTARRTIQGFEAMLWLRKGFGFAGAWMCDQNRLLALCFGLLEVNKA